MKHPLFFTIGFLFITALALLIIPGLDIAAWYFLQPVGFWQKIILVVAELICFFPRFIIGGSIWVGGVSVLKEVSE